MKAALKDCLWKPQRRLVGYICTWLRFVYRYLCTKDISYLDMAYLLLPCQDVHFEIAITNNKVLATVKIKCFLLLVFCVWVCSVVCRCTYHHLLAGASSKINEVFNWPLLKSIFLAQVTKLFFFNLNLPLGWWSELHRSMVVDCSSERFI